MSGRRRLLIVIGVSVLLWPTSLLAEDAPRKSHLIGFLTRKTDSSVSNQIDAFREGLRNFGWIEGKNVAIEYRDAKGQADRLRKLAGELVDLKVDVIVTVDTPPTRAAQEMTDTIPIVVAVSADPVGTGLVKSLAHPGGNTTGLALLAPQTDQKCLELLKETLPQLDRVAMIFDPNNPGMMRRVEALKIAAPRLGLKLELISALSARELAGQLATFAARPPGAMIVLSPIYAAFRDEVLGFAGSSKVPLSVDTKGLAGEPSVLLSFGADISDLFRNAAGFVDKILRGANAADLPVEQPTKFELVINLKTAKAFGLAVPHSMLQRADEVIE
jgi:putative ABC transport system substrate-binding protein